MDSMSRLEQIVARLPEAMRVNVEEGGGHPTFRVRGKNFVFSDQTAEHLSLKLPLAEAEAVMATDDNASSANYGLGRHGWVALTVHPDEDKDRWFVRGDDQGCAGDGRDQTPAGPQCGKPARRDQPDRHRGHDPVIDTVQPMYRF